ncbi:hypothetical protein [Butyrivibrio hungatei]|uniref:Uncharacterized protein n=1 Tax=Butyrivibrio hungatei TaxID=185008 RepID=A0A1D9P5N2_9FIRM|nr:hypothetical protein [Butyrivibrio hungatei]AOZ97880.1 hypothetical protein bhn_II081 [Butyrivibrio hungatei]
MLRNKEELINSLKGQIEGKIDVHMGEMALAVMEQYVKDLEIFLENVRIGEETEEEPSHKVIGFYNLVDDEYIAMEIDKDQPDLDFSEIIFSSKYLPFMPEVWIPAGKPDLKKLYDNEIASSLKNSDGKNTLILTAYCIDQTYIAVDITDKEICIVKGYKDYRDSFTITHENGATVKSNNEYKIYLPSQNFRVLCNLDIPEARISTKMPEEPWEKRPYYIPDTTVINSAIERAELDKNIINKAVTALAISFRKDMKYPEIYTRLELRMRRFERLSNLSAPKEIIKKEYDLIEKSLKELNY